MKAGIYKTPNGSLIYVAKDRTIKATTLKPSTWPGMKVSQQGKNVVFLDYVCERIDDVPNGCTDHQGWLDAKYAERVVGPMSRDNMSTRPARFSPAAAQLLAQSDNAARAQGEMVHKLMDEGYVEVPGTDELVKAYPVSDKPQHKYVGNVPNPIVTSGDADPLKLDARERRFFVESTPGSGGLRAFAEMLNISIDSNMAVDMADAWADAFRESLKRQGWGICHGRSARKHRKRGDNVIPLRGGLFAWKAGKLYPYQRAALKQLRGYMDCPAGMGKTMERFTYQGLTGEQVGYRVSTGACVMTYAGEIEHLKGKTALVKKTHSPGNVLAQFDDRRASRTGEPIERFEGAPPTFALGYGWHSATVGTRSLRSTSCRDRPGQTTAQPLPGDDGRATHAGPHHVSSRDTTRAIPAGRRAPRARWPQQEKEQAVFMTVVGLVFALLYYILKGIAQALYHETPWLVQMQGQEIEQSWAHIIAGLLSIACACAAAFCLVFAAASAVLA